MAEAKVIRQEPKVVLTLNEEEATVLFMFCGAVGGGGGGGARQATNSIYRALLGVRQGPVFPTFDGEPLFSPGPWLKDDVEIPAGFLS